MVRPPSHRQSVGLIMISTRYQGPCQFPTLGFVVSRYNQVKSFVPEAFWYIYLSLSRPTSSIGNEETTFTWRRGHLFDEDAAVVLYEHVLSEPVAHVTKVTNKGTKKWYASWTWKRMNTEL